MALQTTIKPFSLQEKFNLLNGAFHLPQLYSMHKNMRSFETKLRVATNDMVMVGFTHSWGNNFIFRDTDLKRKYRELLKIFTVLDGTAESIYTIPIDFHISIPNRTEAEMMKAMKAVVVDAYFLDAPDPYPNTRPETFPKFAQLPAEMRVMIWELLCPHEPRLLEIEVVDTKGSPFTWRSLASLRPPTVLHVNTESRQIGKKYYELIVTNERCTYNPFYFNPHTDTLFASGRDCGDLVFGDWADAPNQQDPEYNYFESDLLSRVQYLALPRYHFSSFPDIVANVPAVKEVLMVYAAVIDYGEEAMMEIEKWIPQEFVAAGLRELQDSELTRPEMESKTQVLDRVQTYREEGTLFQGRPFPAEDRLKIKFMTVVDEEGNDPVFIMES